MKKTYLSPILNILAMLLIIISRNQFDWLAIGALIIMLLSIGNMLYHYKN